MAASLSSTSNDWVSWFKSRDTAATINKRHQEKLFLSFNCEISKSDCIDVMLNNHEITFLQKINFGSKKVSLFHNLVAVGGTIRDSESKQYGFIQGVGKSTASKMTPDIDILSQIESEIAINIPNDTALFGLSNKDQVDGLTGIDSGLEISSQFLHLYYQQFTIPL